MARSRNYEALLKAVSNNDLKGVRRLIQAKKIDPNFTKGGFAALYHAQSAAMVDLLCQLGASPHSSMQSGELCGGYFQPIHTAANADVLRALVRNGADITAHGGVKRKTVLHFARSVAMVDAIMENGGAAILNARDANGETPLDVCQSSLKMRRHSTNWEVYRCLREKYGAKTGEELDTEHEALVAARKAEAKQADPSRGGGMRR